MRTRVEDWTKLVKNGALPTQSVWTSYTHQLWAGLKYGLGASSAPMDALKKGLGSSNYYLISSLRVVRPIKKEWRYLPVRFGGIGLYDLVTETTAATLNSLMQHYSTKNGSVFDGTFVEARLHRKQLLQVNRARICQEVVFISDIATANGRYIEHHLFRDWKLSHEFDLGMHRSSPKFGVAFPTDKDWDEWRLALSRFTIGP
ncbi:hypothetical protein ACHAXR_009988 [Thalassiosira sp. AJA248-18]